MSTVRPEPESAVAMAAAVNAAIVQVQETRAQLRQAANRMRQDPNPFPAITVLPDRLETALTRITAFTVQTRQRASSAWCAWHNPKET